MYHRYLPYPYYRRYYSISPYQYGRYYNPYYSYQQNVIDSQIADVNQNISNFGAMTDVYQNANVYQLRTSPEGEDVGVCTEPQDVVESPPVINEEPSEI